MELNMSIKRRSNYCQKIPNKTISRKYSHIYLMPTLFKNDRNYNRTLFSHCTPSPALIITPTLYNQLSLVTQRIWLRRSWLWFLLPWNKFSNNHAIFTTNERRLKVMQILDALRSSTASLEIIRWWRMSKLSNNI